MSSRNRPPRGALPMLWQRCLIRSTTICDAFAAAALKDVGSHRFEIGNSSFAKNDGAVSSLSRASCEIRLFTMSIASSSGTAGRVSSIDAFTRALIDAIRSACSSSSRWKARSAARMTSLADPKVPSSTFSRIMRAMAGVTVTDSFSAGSMELLPMMVG
jgi:hypothetical protein